jgi:hypothetical protein
VLEAKGLLPFDDSEEPGEAFFPDAMVTAAAVPGTGRVLVPGTWLDTGLTTWLFTGLATGFVMV